MTDLRNILSAGGNASANAAKIIFDFSKSRFYHIVILTNHQ